MNQQTYYQKNIMIVEEDSDIAKELQDLCKNHDFQVTTVDTGRNCLLELEKGFQGIIILDIWIPIMDCVATIKKIITNGFTTDQNAIVVLTEKRIQGHEFDEIYPYIHENIFKPFH
jgi:DNA-binding response OmpR family regulator